MTLFFGFVVALFVSLVAMPALMRVSQRVNLIDRPNPRKIHAVPVPRCGGVAIAVGTVLPVLLWMPIDPLARGYLVAAAIILVFGLWDDIRPLSYKWKLLGQIPAVLVAMEGGVVVSHVPGFGLDPAPPWITYPLTALFLLGVTNAVNLFDGLDGLAGGCVLLSLSVIALLAYQGGEPVYALMALAAMGGVFGFLRFNTHPASVFMGDSGSQFLGFTTAVLAIVVIERCNTALSPALPLFLLGLPILDTLLVMTTRIASGRSPFTPDRTHIHHRLLALNFRHYEAVAIIYVVQALMVVTGYMLRYEKDLVVVAAFAALAGAFVGPLLALTAAGWQKPGTAEPSADAVSGGEPAWFARRPWLPGVVTGSILVAVSAFVLVGAAFAPDIPPDCSVLGFGVGGLVVAGSLLAPNRRRVFARIGIYVAAVVVAYLVASWQANDVAVGRAVTVFLIGVAILLVIALRRTREEGFRATTQDLLILFLALAVPNLSGETLAHYHVGEIALMLVVVLYGSEFALAQDARAQSVITLAAIASLTLLGVRGMMTG